MDHATARALGRILCGEVALTRAAALLARRLRTPRHRGMAQVVMETSAANTSTLMLHLRCIRTADVGPRARFVLWLAGMALRLGDRWALRFLALRLRRQRELTRQALLVVDASAHELLFSRLVPSSRLARLVLRGDPVQGLIGGQAVASS